LTFLLLALAAGTLTTDAWAGGKGFYPDGQTKWEYLFQNGTYLTYSADGKLLSEYTFSAGELQ
jgi:antitoxin component YwqK of YwqJK toxin-antitoxin module